MNGNNNSFAKQFRYPAKECRSLCMDMDNIIFAQCTVQSCKERRTYCCQTFFLNCQNRFLADARIFCFLITVKFCTADMVALTVVTGNLIPSLCHSGTELFDNDFHSALSGEPFLAKHGNCKFLFHTSSNCFHMLPTSIHLFSAPPSLS